MSATTVRETIVEITITDGGSKFELLQQLAIVGMRDDNHKRITKNFRIWGHIKDEKAQLENIVELLLQVCGISAEDGSGNSWLISGFYPAGQFANGYLSASGRFEGYYNSRTRKGFLKIIFN